MVQEIRIQDISKEGFVDLIDKTIENRLNSFFKDKADKKRSIQSIAVEFNVDPLTVRNWIKKGLFTNPIKIGRRIYILQSDLDKAVQEFKTLKYKR